MGAFKFLKGMVLAAVAQLVVALATGLAAYHPTGDPATVWLVGAAISILAGALHWLANKLGINGK